MAETLGTFEAGDTIEPVVTFHDWAEPPAVGAPIDPLSVTVTIYDSDENIVDNTLIPIHEGGPNSGIYHVDWTLPSTLGTYIIEFRGVISGKPAINRATVKVKFVT